MEKKIAELEQRLKAYEAEREEMAELKAKNEAMKKKIEEEESKWLRVRRNLDIEGDEEWSPRIGFTTIKRL